MSSIKMITKVTILTHYHFKIPEKDNRFYIIQRYCYWSVVNRSWSHMTQVIGLWTKETQFVMCGLSTLLMVCTYTMALHSVIHISVKIKKLFFNFMTPSYFEYVLFEFQSKRFIPILIFTRWVFCWTLVLSLDALLE